MAYVDVGTPTILEGMKIGYGNGLRPNQSDFNTRLTALESLLGLTILGIKSGAYGARGTTFDVEFLNYVWPANTSYLKIIGYATGSSYSGVNSDSLFTYTIEVSGETLWGGRCNATSEAYFDADSFINEATTNSLGRSRTPGSGANGPLIYIDSIDYVTRTISLYSDNNDGSDYAACVSVTIEALGYDSATSSTYSDAGAVSEDDLVVDTWMNQIRSNDENTESRLDTLESGVTPLQFKTITSGDKTSVHVTYDTDLISHTWDADAKFLKLWCWATGTSDNGYNARSHGYWVIDIDAEEITGAFSNAADDDAAWGATSRNGDTVATDIYLTDSEEPAGTNYCPGHYISEWNIGTRTITIASKNNRASDWTTRLFATIEDWA